MKQAETSDDMSSTNNNVVNIKTPLQNSSSEKAYTFYNSLNDKIILKTKEVREYPVNAGSFLNIPAHLVSGSNIEVFTDSTVDKKPLNIDGKEKIALDDEKDLFVIHPKG